MHIFKKIRRIFIPLIVSVSNHRIPVLEKEIAAHHPAASSSFPSYTLAQRKSNGEQLVVSIIAVAEPEGGGGGRSKGKEGKEESAEVAESWIAASAAPWPPCTGFRGTLSVALAMKVPKPSSDS